MNSSSKELMLLLVANPFFSTGIGDGGLLAIPVIAVPVTVELLLIIIIAISLPLFNSLLDCSSSFTPNLASSCSPEIYPLPAGSYLIIAIIEWMYNTVLPVP